MSNRKSGGEAAGGPVAKRGARVTIADIAREAGVSVPTVSKVLNRRSEVAPETRRRVEALLAKHRYTRRAPRQRDRTGLIALVFSEIDGPWPAEIVRAAEEAARENGYGTLVTAAGPHAASSAGWAENAALRAADGVVVVASEAGGGRPGTGLRDLGVPAVLVDPVGRPDDRVPSVGAANWSGAVRATEHLIELGHRRIGHLAGRNALHTSRARLDGYRSALVSAGLPADPDLVAGADDGRPPEPRPGHAASAAADPPHAASAAADPAHAASAVADPVDAASAAGERQARRLLALADPPTALFADSDLHALGALRAVRALGVRVPEELSLVGFDDLPAARWADPALTTVRQPVGEMARMAVRMLLRRQEAGGFAYARIELATELVVRASTGRPAA